MRTTKAQRKLINDARIAGYTVGECSSCIDIFKVNKEAKPVKTMAGLVYPISIGIRMEMDGTAHRKDVSADSALTIRTQKMMREILGLTKPKQTIDQESTQEPTPLTNSEIQEMLDRNRMQISFNPRTSKYELRQMRGGKTIDVVSSQFKTQLITTVRLFDLQRSKRT